MKLNIWFVWWVFFAKLVSLEMEKEPNTEIPFFPKASISSPLAVFSGETLKGKAVPPQLKAACWAWVRFGGNNFLSEHWGQNTFMCLGMKVSRKTWNLNGNCILDWKTSHFCLKTGTSWCSWVLCWVFGSHTTPNWGLNLELLRSWRGVEKEFT